MDAGEAQSIARLMGAAGTDGFGAALDALARRQAAFDMSVLLVYSPRRRPVLIHDGYTDRISQPALDAYLDHAYLLGPFYVASVGGHPPGLWRMGDLAPDSFFASGFMTAPDVHPCISTEAGTLAEEVGFLIPLQDGVTATYSLMRVVQGQGFSPAEFEALRAIEPILRRSIADEWSLRQPPQNQGICAGQDMETLFAALFSDCLTVTQRRVVSLLLRGHSALSIAMTMGISEGTAKNHRANIYKRLNISSQGELFRLFIDHLGRRPAATAPALGNRPRPAGGIAEGLPAQ